MAEKMFGEYPDISGITSESTQTNSDFTSSHKLEKAMKKLAKQIKKHRKMYKREFGDEKSTANTSEKSTSAKDTEKTRQEHKTFWSKVGDVFLKTLPALLSAVVTVVIPAIFGRGGKGCRQWEHVTA